MPTCSFIQRSLALSELEGPEPGTILPLLTVPLITLLALALPTLKTSYCLSLSLLRAGSSLPTVLPIFCQNLLPGQRFALGRMWRGACRLCAP